MSLPLPYRDLEDYLVRKNFEAIVKQFPLQPTTANFTQAPQARVYHDAAISIGNGASATLGTTAGTTTVFNSERHDLVPPGVTQQHSTSSNPGRLTCRVTGSYFVQFQASFASSATGYRQANLRLNGTSLLAIDNRPPVSGGATRLAVATRARLAVGDYVEVQVFQTSGAALDLESSAQFSPEFSWAWLSP